MWTVVYMTQNENHANKLMEILHSESILAKIRNAGEDSGCFEVLVPQTELNAAQNLIFENDLL